MKYLGISGGRLIESFVIIPSIDITWMYEGKYIDVRFSWLFWYFTIGTIRKYLKSRGY